MGMTKCVDVGEIDAGQRLEGFCAHHVGASIDNSEKKSRVRSRPRSVGRGIGAGRLARSATIASEMMLVSREQLGDTRESMLEYQIKVRAETTH